MNTGHSRSVCVALGLALAGMGLAPDDGASRLVGTWSWTWKDAAGATHKHVLEVEGSGEKLSARERFDDEEPVKVTDLKLTDKKVTFSVSRDKRQASYSGTLKSADLIEGLVNASTGGQTNEFGWEARREAAKKK
jgi:hypothetical protein